MVDLIELEKKIDENIAKKRRLGMQADGSGHLGFKSIKKKRKDIKEIIHEGRPATEVIIAHEIYTESEFEHDPEDDIYYTEKYKDRMVFDDGLNLVLYEDI